MLAAARRHFEPAKQTLGSFLGRLGIPPSLITLAGLALALVASVTYTRLGPFPAALVGTAASLTDFVDGAVARYQNSRSAWGDYLDAVVDRLVELILLLTLVPDLGAVVAYAIAASMFISYCKPRVALVINTDNHDWPGIADHADRMVILLVSMALAQISLRAAQYGIALLAVAATVGAIQRLIYAYGLIRKHTSAQTPPPPQ